MGLLQNLTGIEAGKCQGSKCKLHMVETRFSIVGAVTEVLLLSCKGLIVRAGKLVSKVARSLKMKYAPSITKDFAVLFKFLNKAKKGKPLQGSVRGNYLHGTSALLIPTFGPSCSV